MEFPENQKTRPLVVPPIRIPNFKIDINKMRVVTEESEDLDLIENEIFWQFNVDSDDKLMEIKEITDEQSFDISWHAIKKDHGNNVGDFSLKSNKSSNKKDDSNRPENELLEISFEELSKNTFNNFGKNLFYWFPEDSDTKWKKSQVYQQETANNQNQNVFDNKASPNISYKKKGYWEQPARENKLKNPWYPNSSIMTQKLDKPETCERSNYETYGFYGTPLKDINQYFNNKNKSCKKNNLASYNEKNQTQEILNGWEPIDTFGANNLKQNYNLVFNMPKPMSIHNDWKPNKFYNETEKEGILIKNENLKNLKNSKDIQKSKGFEKKAPNVFEKDILLGGLNSGSNISHLQKFSWKSIEKNSTDLLANSKSDTNIVYNFKKYFSPENYIKTYGIKDKEELIRLRQKKMETEVEKDILNSPVFSKNQNNHRKYHFRNRSSREEILLEFTGDDSLKASQKESEIDWIEKDRLSASRKGSNMKKMNFQIKSSGNLQKINSISKIISSSKDLANENNCRPQEDQMNWVDNANCNCDCHARVYSQFTTNVDESEKAQISVSSRHKKSTIQASQANISRNYFDSDEYWSHRNRKIYKENNFHPSCLDKKNNATDTKYKKQELIQSKIEAYRNLISQFVGSIEDQDQEKNDWKNCSWALEKWINISDRKKKHLINQYINSKNNIYSDFWIHDKNFVKNKGRENNSKLSEQGSVSAKKKVWVLEKPLAYFGKHFESYSKKNKINSNSNTELKTQFEEHNKKMRQMKENKISKIFKTLGTTAASGTYDKKLISNVRNGNSWGNLTNWKKMINRNSVKFTSSTDYFKKKDNEDSHLIFTLEPQNNQKSKKKLLLIKKQKNFVTFDQGLYSKSRGNSSNKSLNVSNEKLMPIKIVSTNSWQNGYIALGIDKRIGMRIGWEGRVEKKAWDLQENFGSGDDKGHEEEEWEGFVGIAHQRSLKNQKNPINYCYSGAKAIKPIGWKRDLRNDEKSKVFETVSFAQTFKGPLISSVASNNPSKTRGTSKFLKKSLDNSPNHKESRVKSKPIYAPTPAFINHSLESDSFYHSPTSKVITKVNQELLDVYERIGFHSMKNMFKK